MGARPLSASVHTQGNMVLKVMPLKSQDHPRGMAPVNWFTRLILHVKKLWLCPLSQSKAFSPRSLSLSMYDIVDIVDHDDPQLVTFYELYQRLFVLEEEREPLAAFHRLLELNHDPFVQAEFGPLHERIAIALEPGAAAAVGLINYVLYAYPSTPSRAWSFAGSCQLNFIGVAEPQRGKGLATMLLDHLERQLDTFVTSLTQSAATHTFISIEQNNSSRMTPEQRLADWHAAKIEPERRLRWWEKKGYRRLDFPYQQPPLGADVTACNYLDYFARVRGDATRSVDALPATVLAEHLRRFFFVSVGKCEGQLGENTVWRTQQAHLQARTEVPFAPIYR